MLLLNPHTNKLSNTHNNRRPQVDCFASDSSTYSIADQDIVSDEIIYSYERTTSYPMDSVVFQGSKFCIDINLSKDDLKALSTPLNGLSSSVIRGITTPVSLCNINQNDFSVKDSTQFQ